MRATAEQSSRVEKPVWHLTLAAGPGAQLDRESAFGASALRFALAPNPVTAVRAAGAGARALGELGRDDEASQGR